MIRVFSTTAGGSAALFAALLLAGQAGILPAYAAQTATKAAKPAQPQTAAKIDFSALPKSVFRIPASPREGRDPFFPNATAVAQAPVMTTNAAPVVETSVFVLNGITGPPVRSAMINGRTFLQGEEGEVRLASGAKVLIKCAEIGDERAIIEVAGTRRELRLRLGI